MRPQDILGFFPRGSALDIAALEQRLKSGDDTAFVGLFESLRDRMRRLVHFRMDRRVRGRVDPEDVIQEAFLDARARLSHFIDGDFPGFFFWLRMVVAQTLSRTHRAHLGAQIRTVEREVSPGLGPDLPDTSASLSYHLMAQVTSPSRALDRDERSERLHQALQAMSPLDREIIALRHFEELSNSETATLLQLRPQTASQRYVRAMERLHRILQRLELK